MDTGSLSLEVALGRRFASRGSQSARPSGRRPAGALKSKPHAAHARTHLGRAGVLAAQPEAPASRLTLTGQPLLTMLRGSPTWVLAAASPAAPAALRPPTAPHPPLSTEATGQWHRGNTWPCDRHGPGKEHRAPRPQPAEDAVNRGPKTPQHCGEGRGLGTGGRVGSSGRAAGNQASWLRLGPRGKVPETENSEDAVCIPFCLRSHTQERMPQRVPGFGENPTSFSRTNNRR